VAEEMTRPLKEHAIRTFDDLRKAP
jgi:hypothetical protein